ncbi:MAG: helix-turn-helix transcriptional regulator [Chloroflexi bacterium]|nr:helix-turn-helix transcriptional regulator [Chloroflexota bacterium]
MQNSKSDYTSELLRGNTENLLLHLIDEQGYAYGYQLIREIEKRSGGFFRFKEGTVYPALRKLEHEGLLQGEWQEPPNGLRRRYYRITPEGKEVLSKRIATWQGFTMAVNLVFKPAGAR